MKKIEAFIKPFTLEPIKSALHASDVQLFRILDAQEFSSSNTYSDVFRGTEYEMDVSPRILLVVLVRDNQVEQVIQCIRDAGQTDHPGDGKIIVTPIERSLVIDSEEIESR